MTADHPLAGLPEADVERILNATAELARLIPSPVTPEPPKPTPARDFDWAAWEQRREDAAAAHGEPDRPDPSSAECYAWGLAAENGLAYWREAAS